MLDFKKINEEYKKLKSSLASTHLPHSLELVLKDQGPVVHIKVPISKEWQLGIYWSEWEEVLKNLTIKYDFVFTK